MSEYFENMGKLGTLKKKREICVNAIQSYKESIRNALPIDGDAELVDGDYIVSLAISLNEKCVELNGYNKKIVILERAVGQ